MRLVILSGVFTVLIAACSSKRTEHDPVNNTEHDPPGTWVTSKDTQGWGPCSGVALEEVLASLPAADGITELYDPDLFARGTFIYALVGEDGGFRLVVHLGSGDCEAGCENHSYAYFQTNEKCEPVEMGSYYAGYKTSDCLTVEGEPMWDIPSQTPSPGSLCGADNTPVDISGSRSLRLSGTRLPCVTTDTEPTEISVNALIEVTIAQTPDDLSTGTITLKKTGIEFVDDRELPATFTRQQLTVSVDESSQTATCPWQHQIDVALNFEGGVKGSLNTFEFGTSCKECKGSAKTTIGPP